MSPELSAALEQLSKVGPTALWAIALILLVWKVFPPLGRFWAASASRDAAMAEELPRMRESLGEIAQNTNLLKTMDVKLDDIRSNVDTLLRR